MPHTQVNVDRVIVSRSLDSMMVFFKNGNTIGSMPIEDDIPICCNISEQADSITRILYVIMLSQCAKVALCMRSKEAFILSGWL